MTKRRQRQDQRASDLASTPFSVGNTQPIKVKPLTARNERQGTYIKLINGNELVFGLGPAGTGKTYIAARLAAQALADRKVQKIVVTRPIVEAGENIGFLPGDMGEKIDPYFVPVREALIEGMGKGPFEYHYRNGTIEFAPFAFMRGRTFADAFVILDEAQNTTQAQMKMFLTRAGDRSKLIVNGDLLQSDIPGPNGLADAVKRFEGYMGVGVMKFRREDVVRSGLAALAVEAYEGEDTREQDEALGQLPLFITGQGANDDRRAA